MSDRRYHEREPRQLGTLHDRMACVLHLMRTRLGSDGGVNTDLWHAVYDLATLVEHAPDIAFHRRDDSIVPASHRHAKKGIPAPDWDCRGKDDAPRPDEAAAPAEAVQFARDFLELFRTSDMTPADECHILYARAEAIVAKAGPNP
jgi:hypothetical protein